MCESVKSERPALTSGHSQEADGGDGDKKVSRRGFLAGMVAGTVCFGSGIIISEAIKT